MYTIAKQIKNGIKKKNTFKVYKKSDQKCYYISKTKIWGKRNCKINSMNLIYSFFCREYMQGGKYKKDTRIDGKVVIITGANSGIGKGIDKYFWKSFS